MAAPPQFCPWCGTPIAYAPHEHEPHYDLDGLPERIRAMIEGEAHVGACAGCRTISHVVGHRAQPESADERT